MVKEDVREGVVSTRSDTVDLEAEARCLRGVTVNDLEVGAGMILDGEDKADCSGGFTDIRRGNPAQDSVVSHCNLEVSATGDLEVFQEQVIDAIIVAG